MFLILAIDDDRNMLNLLIKQVETMGHRLITAQSGNEGLEHAKSGNPDLILLDIMMPEMDGFEVVRKLRIEENTKNTPVIMITSKSDRTYVLNSMRYGVIDYIVKPYNFFMLSKKIDAALKYGVILREQDMIERTSYVDVSKDSDNTIISFKSELGSKVVLDEAKRIFNSTFVNRIGSGNVVLDLRTVPEFNSKDVSFLEKIIALFGTKNLHIIAGKHYGTIIESSDLEDRVKLFISFGDFEIFVNQE